MDYNENRNGLSLTDQKIQLVVNHSGEEENTIDLGNVDYSSAAERPGVRTKSWT